MYETLFKLLKLAIWTQATTLLAQPDSASLQEQLRSNQAQQQEVERQLRDLKDERRTLERRINPPPREQIKQGARQVGHGVGSVASGVVQGVGNVVHDVGEGIGSLLGR